MNSADLMFFAAVANAKSIGRAAVVLNTVQSNVTSRVLALERSLGVPLFYRSSKGVSLTGAGERLLPYAKQVAGALAEARLAVAAVGQPAGTLRIGSMETTAAFRLPDILSAFADANPDVDLNLDTGPTEQLIERVLARSLDGAFVSGPIVHDDLETRPVFDEELVMAAPRTVRTLADALARLANGHGLKLVVFRAGCSYRRVLDEFAAANGFVHLRRMELGTLDGILGCVAAGLGITLVPRVVAAPAHAAGMVSIHDLPAGHGCATTVLATRRDLHVTPAFAAFASGLPDLTRPASRCVAEPTTLDEDEVGARPLAVRRVDRLGVR